MEKLVLQSDNTDFIGVDAFIHAVCETNYVNNYFATISVPVMNAIQCAVSCCSENQEITLIFDYFSKGIAFAVACQCGSFVSEELLFVVRMLSDDVEVADDGRTLKMFFNVRGIDAREAAQRVSVLNHYFRQAVRAELLQM